MSHQRERAEGNAEGSEQGKGGGEGGRESNEWCGGGQYNPGTEVRYRKGQAD